MSNVNNPHGLSPLGTSLSGGPQAVEQYTKQASDADAIYRQDPVQRSGGYITASGITPGTTYYSGVALNYGAASTLTTHQIVISPDAIYEVQSDSTGVAVTNLGDNANLTVSTNSGQTLPPHLSNAVLNGSTIATTNTLDVHILNLYATVGTAYNPDSGNGGPNNFGAYARVEIVFNKHRMNGGVAGA